MISTLVLEDDTVSSTNLKYLSSLRYENATEVLKKLTDEGLV